MIYVNSYKLYMNMLPLLNICVRTNTVHLTNVIVLYIKHADTVIINDIPTVQVQILYIYYI